MALPLPEFHQFHFVLSLPLLSLLLFLSKFIRKRRKTFPSFAFSFASHLHFMFTFISLQEHVLWWYHYLVRMVLWCVIAHKNDFVECYHPQERFL